MCRLAQGSRNESYYISRERFRSPNHIWRKASQVISIIFFFVFMCILRLCFACYCSLVRAITCFRRIAHSFFCYFFFRCFFLVVLFFIYFFFNSCGVGHTHAQPRTILRIKLFYFINFPFIFWCCFHLCFQSFVSL